MFAGKLSGKDADRPEPAAYLDYLRPGDTLVVPSMDRLSRSLADLIAIVTALRRRGVGHYPRRSAGLSRLRRPGGVYTDAPDYADINRCYQQLPKTPAGVQDGEP